ncbi:hypothetical protein Tco_0735407 [Tanacetum coccineum]
MIVLSMSWMLNKDYLEILRAHETEVPQPSSPPHTNVANEAASIGVDVRYGRAATTVTGLEARQGSGNIDKTPTMTASETFTCLPSFIKSCKIGNGYPTKG